MLPAGVAQAINFFGKSTDATQYVKTMYLFGTAIVGAAAMAAIALAGINYMRAQGNEERVTKSKEMLAGALIGLALVMGSYVLLKTLDPQLVEFKIETVDMKGVKQDLADKIGGSAPSCTSDKDCTGFYIDIWECNAVYDDFEHSKLLKTKCTNGKCLLPEGGVCGIESYGSGLQLDCDQEYGGSSNPQKCPPTTPNCKDSDKEPDTIGVANVIGGGDDPNLRTCQK